MSSEEKKSEIQTLIRRRSAFKGRLTKFADFLELLASRGVTAPPQEADGFELETRTITLESVFSEFEQYQDKMEGLVEDEEVQIQFQERESVESRYFPLIARAKQIIAKQSDLPRRPSSQGGSEHGSRVDEESDVKLPPIKIPQFSGAYEEWMPFCDMFTSLVHEKPGLSSIRKFHYLRGALSGRAARAVQGLEITAENYEAAWNLLKKRYKNENLIIHNHIKAIVEHPKMAKGSITFLTDLVDAVQAHLRSLQALKQPVKKWDTLLIYLIADKLDADTKHVWESEYLENDDAPTMSDFTDFLEKRYRLLEKTHKHEKSAASRGPTEVKGKQKNKTTSNVASTGERKANCVVCGGEHPLFSCSTFNEMTVQSRIDQVKKHKLCLNCLRSGHICVNCKSSHCRKCGKTHNTLLHFENSTDTKDQQPKLLEQQTTKKESQQTDFSPSVNAYSGRNKGDHRVLPTAIAQVLDRNGKLQDCTMLLDCGSQSNFMTMDLCRRLGLKTSKVSIPVTGIFQTKSSVLETAIATIRSKHSSFEATLSVLLVPQITDTLPSEPINLETLKLPVGIKLADPNFTIPKKIDMLLGVDVFWDIVTATNNEHPFLHETKLGFVVSGSIPRIIGTTAKTICNLSTIDLSQQLEKFWETEHCPASRQLSTEERECELHFVANCSRDKCGRFIVSVPFKGSVDARGDSLDQATKRFLSLERKLNGNQSLKNRYTDFMDQYQKMGHMTNVEETVANPNSYYLPHHGVIKESSSTTKLRVVFDGSAPTTTGVSINDLHMVGPTIQKDLLSILLRFRKYVYAVSADVQMMYRQILVNPNQRPYQRILWRTERSQPIETFELNTVTYGLASSSFLAIRCLFHLADSCHSSRPDVAKAIRESMYSAIH